MESLLKQTKQYQESQSKSQHPQKPLTPQKTQEHKLTVQLKDKELVVRKWKGKDKREFISQMQSETPNEKAIMDTLVYGCIESPDPSSLILSTEEFKYAITLIRGYSLGEEITYNFFCTECQETKERIYNIRDIFRPKYQEGNRIQSEGVDIILGDIRNREFYLNMVQESEIYDFLLRIQSINGNDTFDLNYLTDFFDNLDIDILDDVLKQYDLIRFKIDDVNEFVCDCGHVEEYHFDEVPEFFPSEWFTDSMIGSFSFSRG